MIGHKAIAPDFAPCLVRGLAHNVFVKPIVATMGMSLVMAGSLADAMMAGAMSIAQMGVWTAVGGVIADLGIQATLGAAFAAFAAVKCATHGVVGGAISAIQDATSWKALLAVPAM